MKILALIGTIEGFLARLDTLLRCNKVFNYHCRCSIRSLQVHNAGSQRGDSTKPHDLALQISDLHLKRSK